MKPLLLSCGIIIVYEVCLPIAQGSFFLSKIWPLVVKVVGRLKVGLKHWRVILQSINPAPNTLGQFSCIFYVYFCDWNIVESNYKYKYFNFLTIEFEDRDSVLYCQNILIFWLLNLKIEILYDSKQISGDFWIYICSYDPLQVIMTFCTMEVTGG